MEDEILILYWGDMVVVGDLYKNKISEVVEIKREWQVRTISTDNYSSEELCYKGKQKYWLL